MNTITMNKFYSAYKSVEEANERIVAVEDYFSMSGLDVNEDFARVSVSTALDIFGVEYNELKILVHKAFPVLSWENVQTQQGYKTRVKIDFANPYNRSVTDITN